MRYLALCGLSCFILSPLVHAECYEYDELGRLVEILHDGAAVPETTYAYDDNGNRTSIETYTSSSDTCSIPSAVGTNGASDPTLSGDYDSSGSPQPVPTGNMDPVTDNEYVTIAPGASAMVLPLDGDTDANGDTLALVSVVESSPLITVSMSGNQVTVVSSLGNGTATATYRVTDGNGGEATGEIIVTIETPPPPPPPMTDICEIEPDSIDCDSTNGGQPL